MQTINAFDRTRWFRCLNQSGSDAPAFAALKVVGVTDEQVLLVTQPDTDSEDVLIGGPAPIASGSYGICTRDSPATAGYDPSQGTPAYGDVWSAQAGAWLLGKRGSTTEGLGVIGSPCPGLLLGTRYPLTGQKSLLKASLPAINAGDTITISWDPTASGSYTTGEFDPNAPTQLTVKTAAGTNGPPYRYFLGFLGLLTFTAESTNLIASSVAGSSTFTAGTYYWLIVVETASGQILGDSSAVYISGSTVQAHLSWTAQAGATGYKIYRSDDGGVTYPTLVTTVGSGTTSYTDTGSGSGSSPYSGTATIALLRNGSPVNSWSFITVDGSVNFTTNNSGAWYHAPDGADCQVGDVFELQLTNGTPFIYGSAGIATLVAGLYR